ncbi:MAG: UDP-glucose 6-dehydrogenase [Deltaproteobacteria bacterium GWB2_55_19]|nr:MAG: UDP-glucose 6-dehydrogenase [Deltaproteobacteria bacterium GWB2_55_19]HAO93802.1 UDP-glucose 6-dehydrogenase [Deltaproteobacteria bacterium]
MNICVIGTGYVGLVTGTCFADFGVNVSCVDKDVEKIEMLRRGEIPIFEPGLKEIVAKNISEKRLTFTTDLSEAIKKSLVIFIAVGTPPKEDGSADLSYIEEVARAIAENLNGYKVIVTKSTVPVGTGALIEKIISSEQKGEFKFDVASNPEFLREGSAVEDFMRPNRVVIGARSPQAVAIMKDLYSPLYLIETPFIVTDIETSELIKYASNAFLATKISFINEMANICERVGADIHMVAKGMGLDHRIGGKFLHPGPGYGGSCFPKDTMAITKIARAHGYTFRIVEAVIDVNDRQREIMIEKIRTLAGGIKGKKFGVLGLAFKPNTDDIRDSPAMDIVERLVSEGATVKAYDPAGMEHARKVVKSGVSFCNDSYEVAEGSDALVIMTEWNQFRKLDLARIKTLLKAPRVIDLRNIYEPAAMAKLGFEYVSVGRQDRPVEKTGALSAPIGERV